MPQFPHLSREGDDLMRKMKWDNICTVPISLLALNSTLLILYFTLLIVINILSQLVRAKQRNKRSKRVKSDDWLTEKYMDTFQRLLLVHLTFISSFIHSFILLLIIFLINLLIYHLYYETTVLTKALEYKDKLCFSGKLCIVWLIPLRIIWFWSFVASEQFYNSVSYG